MNKIKFNIEVASVTDSQGILEALKQNLVEIRDVDKLSKLKKKELEEEGFLRKEVNLEYYQELIKEPFTDIFIAKNKLGKIIGFASIHRKKNNIVEVRDVVGNLSFENEKTKKLLLNEEKEFAYLDQVSILPKFKHKGVGTAIFQKALTTINTPIVAFIVEEPIFNKSSAVWHERNGFELQATSSGEYKGNAFKFLIYINWNLTK
ncbi:MAG: N-acetyltransferase [Candidatus Lokiarchaeota archaeon]|nr:N-acetyltransferase [Candidatus Lokiarchaeota archaeon]